MRHFLILTMIASFALAEPAQAEQTSPACGDRADIITQLKNHHHETPTGFGLTGNGAVVELMTSDEGSWTLLLSFPNGRSCLMGTGEGWELWKNLKKVAGKNA